MTKLFSVIPLSPSNKKQAKLMEMIINRPEFVSRVIHFVEKYVREQLVPEFLYCLPKKDIDIWIKENLSNE